MVESIQMPKTLLVIDVCTIYFQIVCKYLRSTVNLIRNIININNNNGPNTDPCGILITTLYQSDGFAIHLNLLTSETKNSSTISKFL